MVTLPLGTLALAWAILVAIPLGVFAAWKHRRPGDWGVMGFTQIGISIPNFWFGIVLVLLFAVTWQWFPAGGFPGWQEPLKSLHALILPALSLSLGEIAILARVTRSAMLDTLREDYVRTARAKGASEGTVLFRHALRNALIPVTTVAGLIAGFLVAGAVIIESVFRLPGVGQLVYDSINNRDLIVIKNVVVLFTILGAGGQPAGRSRLCAARSAAPGTRMRAFIARAARHVGFQIGAVLLVLFVGTALVSLAWTPHPVDALQMRAKLMPSSALYPLGTDHLGRDVLSRIMVGAQTSIAVGLIAVAIGLSAGVGLGAWAAARGGWVDEALSRTSDLIFAFPAVLIAILITSVLGASAQNAILAIAIFKHPGLRAGDARRGAVDVEPRLRARRDRHGAGTGRHHLAPCPAQYRRRADRAGDHPVRRRHPGRGGPVLSRAGRPAAGAVVGPHAARRADLHLPGAGTGRLAGPCHCLGRAGP